MNLLLSNRPIFLVLCLLMLSGCVKTVPFVDVERYMGRWYQIAANPTFFSGDLVGVTADYTLQEDGSVQVINTGFQTTLNGPIDIIEGEAVVVDTDTNSRLRVSFPGAPNFPFANYLIVVLDSQDYEYAVVTDPFRTTLFILNRTPQIDPELYEDILAELEAKGISTNKLLVTLQAINENTGD